MKCDTCEAQAFTEFSEPFTFTQGKEERLHHGWDGAHYTVRHGAVVKVKEAKGNVMEICKGIMS